MSTLDAIEELVLSHSQRNCVLHGVFVHVFENKEDTLNSCCSLSLLDRLLVTVLCWQLYILGDVFKGS